MQRLLCDLLSLPFQDTKNPAGKCPLVLSGKFHHPAIIFHSFIKFSSLIHFGLCQNNTGTVRDLRNILGQLRAGIFSKTAVADLNHTTICKEWHGLRQINDLLRIDVLSLK